MERTSLFGGAVGKNCPLASKMGFHFSRIECWSVSCSSALHRYSHEFWIVTAFSGLFTLFKLNFLWKKYESNVGVLLVRTREERSEWNVILKEKNVDFSVVLRQCVGFEQSRFLLVLWWFWIVCEWSECSSVELLDLLLLALKSTRYAIQETFFFFINISANRWIHRNRQLFLPANIEQTIYQNRVDFSFKPSLYNQRDKQAQNNMTKKVRVLKASSPQNTFDNLTTVDRH